MHILRLTTAAAIAALASRPPAPRLSAACSMQAPRLSAACSMQAPGQESLLEQAVLCAQACSVAFVPPDAMGREPYATNLECIAQCEDPVTHTGATVFTVRSTGQLLIACRGSSGIRNFQTNLNLGPSPFTLTEGGKAHPSAKVHTGFQSAAAALWKLLEREMPPPTAQQPVLVTGHSLGGGIATLVALHLHASGIGPSQLITVAGPRLGNAAFGAVYRERCPIPAVHLVHEADSVALNADVNAQWDRLGFEHVGRVVRCAMEAPCVYEDGEAEACLAEALASAPRGPPSLRASFVEHCKYLGLYIGLRLEHPGVWLRA